MSYYTELFQKNGYDLTACNNVIDILCNTDVINHIVKLIVHSPVGKLVLYIWACAKRCSVWTIHFLVVNASSGLSFPWTNLTLSERVCIKEIIKINLTPKVSFELVKYENLHQVRAKKSAKEGWTFRVHRFSCRFVCIFLL